MYEVQVIFLFANIYFMTYSQLHIIWVVKLWRFLIISKIWQDLHKFSTNLVATSEHQRLECIYTCNSRYKKLLRGCFEMLPTVASILYNKYGHNIYILNI